MKNVLRLVGFVAVLGIAYSFYPLMAVSVGAFVAITSLVLSVPKIIAWANAQTSDEDEQDEEGDQEQEVQVDPVPDPVDDPVEDEDYNIIDLQLGVDYARLT